MSKNLDQLWIGYLSNCKLLAVTKLFKYFLCINLGPGSALWENEKKSALAKKKKKSASEARREVVWGGERVAEPGDICL